MNLLITVRIPLHSFERAACTGGEDLRDRVDGAPDQEEPPDRVPLAELERRARIMFSGETGAVVPSGDGSVTSAPTYELARDARAVIRSLPAALFDINLKQRPCGLLCKLSAAGMLICDVIGLPLTPFELAEPVGKEAARRADQITAEVKREKEAAKRRGLDSQVAEANFLRSRIKLPLPTPADVAKVWRRLEKEAAKKAAPPAPAPPQPSPPQPSPPTTSPAPQPSPPPLETPKPPSDPAPIDRFTSEGFATDEFLDELKSSVDVGRAIVAAHNLERHIPGDWTTDDEMEESEDFSDDSEDEAAEHATTAYKYALRRLGKLYPELTFGGVSNDSTVVAGKENSVPCRCGEGRAGMWLWQLQSHTRGFCDCHLLMAEREEWLKVSMRSCFEESWWQLPNMAAEMIRKAGYRR